MTVVYGDGDGSGMGVRHGVGDILYLVSVFGGDGLEGYLMEERRQIGWDRVVGKRPVCVRCGEPVVTEQYLDLEPFGLRGIACGRCRDRCSHWVQWEE